MRRSLRIALRVAVILLVIAALWWFIRAVDFRRLGEAFASANLGLLVVASLLHLVCLSGKAAAWGVLLAPRHHVSLPRLLRYELVSVAASAITPARAGEVLRGWILKRREGVPPAETAAIFVVHKLLDGAAMMLVLAPLPWLVPGLPPWIGRALVICAAVTLVVLVALYVVAGRVDPTRPSTALRRFIAGIAALRSPRRWAVALLPLLVVWAADLAAVTAVLHAVGIQLPLAAGLLILFTVNLTIIVPSTPAQVGAHEVGALIALDLLHVGNEAALAFALLYHAGQVLPVLASGLALELRLVLGREPDAAPGPAT